MLVKTESSFYLDDPRLVRGVNFAPWGQRIEQWLPVGSYEIVGPCWLSDGRGTLPSGSESDRPNAIKLVARGAGRHGVWFVGKAAFEALPEGGAA